ncbi:MAG: hypothetical protein ACFFCS_22180 [Candidatus Hodarchaeota archaeon]
MDQLNKHNVTIQCMWIPVADENGSLESFSPSINLTDAAKINETLYNFSTNYPNIRFQYYAAGVGYGSCGNYEGSIYTTTILKRFVDVCRNYSFPNVVGVYTDWEGPSDLGPDYRNATRNGWHQAMWAEAFDYVKTYYPDWTMSCCHPDGTM